MPDGLALPLLPDTVRRPPRTPAAVDPAWRWRIATGIVTGHLVLLLLVDAALRPRLPARARDEPGLVIRWIDAEPPAATTQASGDAPRDAVAAPAGTPAAVAADSAGPASTPEPAAAASPADAMADTRRLFAPDGRLQLSREVVDAAGAQPAPEFAPPQAAELPPIRSPVPYRETRFEEDWVPDGETLGEELVRKLSRETEVKTPWGTRWRCKVVIVGVACGDVPPPPMKNRPKMPWETYVEEPQPARPLD